MPLVDRCANLHYLQLVLELVQMGRIPREESDRMADNERSHVAELFAGVGGFRLGLERTEFWQVVWSNQWEPPGSKSRQFASRCYERHFPGQGHHNIDIARQLDRVESGQEKFPKVNLLVGGFPCQDYSVAKPLNQAAGIVGKKGVLWWEIHRLLSLLKSRRRAPRFLFLENVDRLLNSPARQRGRDFAIILRCLADLGYEVEWRTVNAADYGFVQRRRRVMLVGMRRGTIASTGRDRIITHGVLARAFPCRLDQSEIGLAIPDLTLDQDLAALSSQFGLGAARTPFLNAGFMREGKVYTRAVLPLHTGERRVLNDILEDDDSVPKDYFIPPEQMPKWRYLKGAKSEPRRHKASGTAYHYVEGALPFPDPRDRPGRTILTGEGGSSPSRFKHVVETSAGRFRRLTPVELERLNGFPDGWTATGMTDVQRAFCMGNALVVDLVHKVGAILADVASSGTARTRRNGQAVRQVAKSPR